MLFNAWAKILEIIREEKGLSREKAAQRGGVATVTWYRWENGLSFPSAEQLDKMACKSGEITAADELGEIELLRTDQGGKTQFGSKKCCGCLQPQAFSTSR